MGLLARVATEMGAKAGLRSAEELAERRTASEAILGLIEPANVESIVGGDRREGLAGIGGLQP